MMKVFKEIKLSLLVLILLSAILVLSPTSSFATSMTMTDMEDHWAKAQIESWVEKGYIKGYPDGTFKPYNTMSRVEFMALVNSSFGYTDSATYTFKDVPAGSWYAPIVGKAVAAGYISGKTDYLMPKQPISREEAATIMMSITNLQSNIAGAAKFTDLNALTWGKGPVGCVVTAGIMNGYPDNSFRPEGFLNRAEAVTALSKAKTFIANSTVSQTLTGYIMDEHCFIKKPVPGLDSKVCLQMPTCAATGFGVAVLQSNGLYKYYYFDGAFAPTATASQTLAINLINNTVKKDHIYVSVTGIVSGEFKTAPDGFSYLVMNVSKISEADAPAKDLI